MRISSIGKNSFLISIYTQKANILKIRLLRFLSNSLCNTLVLVWYWKLKPMIYGGGIGHFILNVQFFLTTNQVM